MKYPKLFEPTRIGALELRNRIVLSPAHTNFTVDNKYTDRYIEYYKERAKGGVGLIISAHVMPEVDVDPYPTTFGYPTLDSAAEIKYFTELVEGVHQYGAKIAIELSPGTGRLADELIEGKPPLGPSEIPLLLMPTMKTQELTKEEIRQLINSYGKSAGLAKRAGFDAIYIHFLAYLGDQFLSACWNHRRDEYGGSLENRMKFLRDCIDSVRENVGEGFPLIVGLALDHGFPGGRELEETIKIAKLLEPLNIDALHLRRGSYDAMTLLIPTAYMEDGVSVDHAHQVKKAVNIPVIVDGKLSDIGHCEALLCEGKTDFIGMARPFITDPHWPNKARTGNEKEILHCIRCMECIDRVFFAKYSACSVNPEYGREYKGPITKSKNPQKVLVAGGGAAGMTAARFLAKRGHDVTLMEKSGQLGGHLLEAAVPSYKKGTKQYLQWLVRQVMNLPMEIKLNTPVTADLVAHMQPNVLIVSTGSTPFVPQVAGIEGKNVRLATELLVNYRDLEDNIVIVGAGLVGCETALFLREKGKKNITLIDMLPVIAQDVIFMERGSLLAELERKEIKQKTGLQLKEVTSTGIVVKDENGKEESIKANTIVMATGLQANDSLFNDLKDKVTVDEIYKIGDCVAPRKFIDAVHEAYTVAMSI
ncbi:MAG: FAD-dependent oxidoreductase [Firmicutes bacterium]|nr:FAD-dependent oxidoreductase [Bacillota bacterium]